jgi:ribose 5-phosphate isomerase B
MRVAVGNDHAAVDMKKDVVEYLSARGYEVTDLGTNTTDADSYTEYGLAVGEAIVAGEADCGVLICGTGVGISMSANKVPGIRAAVCSEPVTAGLVKKHNNANIIAFGARIVGTETAHAILDAYFDTEFEGGRHNERIADIRAIEEKYSKI